jgi:hypothetical protein
MTRIHWIVFCEASQPICKFCRCENFLAPILVSDPGTSTPNSSRYADDTTATPHTRKDARQKKGSPKTSVWTEHLKLLAVACHLLSRSNVMSVNTPFHSKIDFATKDNFDCKHFILKSPQKRERQKEWFAENAQRTFLSRYFTCCKIRYV